MNEESLFAAALDKPSTAERQAFLDEECAGDVRLRQRVDQLLAADLQRVRTRRGRLTAEQYEAVRIGLERMSAAAETDADSD